MYRWIEHTGEVELEIDAESEADVFRDGLAALGELVGDEAAGGRECHELALSASDLATLLADWLTELVFLAETEDFVPERAAALELAGVRLAATVEGHRGRPAHLVKAVTYHRLEFVRLNGRWRARVVLDV